MTDARMFTEYCASRLRVSVTTGNTACLASSQKCAQPVAVEPGVVCSCAGNSRHSTAKNATSSMPNQNSGIAYSTTADWVSVVSRARPRFQPATRPRYGPRIDANSVPSPTRITVFGKACNSAELTDCPVAYDVPRSKDKVSLTYRTNCTH